MEAEGHDSEEKNVPPMTNKILNPTPWDIDEYFFMTSL